MTERQQRLNTAGLFSIAVALGGLVIAVLRLTAFVGATYGTVSGEHQQLFRENQQTRALSQQVVEQNQRVMEQNQQIVALLRQLTERKCGR